MLYISYLDHNLDYKHFFFKREAVENLSLPQEGLHTYSMWDFHPPKPQILHGRSPPRDSVFTILWDGVIVCAPQGSIFFRLLLTACHLQCSHPLLCSSDVESSPRNMPLLPSVLHFLASDLTLLLGVMCPTVFSNIHLSSPHLSHTKNVQSAGLAASPILCCQARNDPCPVKN